MKLGDGQRFKLLVDDLKKTKGLTRQEIAEMMGISAPHLSHIFRNERITPEIRERAIKALDLPLDFFDNQPGAAPPNPSREDEIAALREQARAALADLLKMKEKYIALLEKHNAMLEQKKE